MTDYTVFIQISLKNEGFPPVVTTSFKVQADDPARAGVIALDLACAKYGEGAVQGVSEIAETRQNTASVKSLASASER